MLNIISTCRNILCVDINVDKRCVDHSTSDAAPWPHFQSAGREIHSFRRVEEFKLEEHSLESFNLIRICCTKYNNTESS